MTSRSNCTGHIPWMDKNGCIICDFVSRKKTSKIKYVKKEIPNSAWGSDNWSVAKMEWDNARDLEDSGLEPLPIRSDS